MNVGQVNAVCESINLLHKKHCDLIELCGFMIATIEVNLDRGSLRSDDDEDFRRLIEGWKKRFAEDKL